jgi:hypothetical protein
MILDLGNGLNERSVSGSCRFTPGKEPRYSMQRRLRGIRAGMETVVEKNLFPLPVIEPRSSSQSLYRPSYRGLISIHF